MKSELEIFTEILDWLEDKGFYVDRRTLFRDFGLGKALPNQISVGASGNTLATLDIPVVVSDHMPDDCAAVVVTEKQNDGTVVVKDAAVLKGFKRV